MQSIGNAFYLILTLKELSIFPALLQAIRYPSRSWQWFWFGLFWVVIVMGHGDDGGVCGDSGGASYRSGF